MKRTTKLVLLLGTVVISTCCNSRNIFNQPTPVLVEVTLSGPMEIVGINQTIQYRAFARFSDSTTMEVTTHTRTTWNSALPGAATVTNQGLVTSRGRGSTRLTVLYQGFQDSFLVMITVPPQQFAGVLFISIDKITK